MKSMSKASIETDFRDYGLSYPICKQKQTNADRIRSMSDDELAEWLTKITDDAQLDAATKCDYQWKDWLQSEVEE